MQPQNAPDEFVRRISSVCPTNLPDEFPDEEVAASWILGRYPQGHFDLDAEPPIWPFGEIGWAFPRFMSPGNAIKYIPDKEGTP